MVKKNRSGIREPRIPDRSIIGNIVTRRTNGLTAASPTQVALASFHGSENSRAVQSVETASPPARVPSPLKTRASIVCAMKLTDPSPRQNNAPPGCRLLKLTS